MISPEHKLPVRQQCRILKLSRASVYYQKKPESDENLKLMRKMDEMHLEHPYMGTRFLKRQLKAEGFQVSRKRVRRLMRLMGICALYRKPKTSQRHSGHKVYPYLLRDLKITEPNHVWAADITYIPMKRGFVYLFAVLDWASRKVLSWRLSNTLTTDFCIEAVNEAICKYGRPEIFNTDQGCQFTSEAFTSLLRENEIKISMDGKGCWRDNVFVERLWKSVKYEEVYLKAYACVSEGKQSLDRYFRFYNERRRHSSLDDQTPNEFYERNSPKLQRAA